MVCIERWSVNWSMGLRRLIQSGNCERVILKMLNESSRVMPNKPLVYVQDQSHGECDYIDCAGKKYDAKLLLNQLQGQMLGNPKNDWIASACNWFKTLLEESNNYFNVLFGLSIIEDTSLFSIIEGILKKLAEDEVGILFIPFPIVSESREEIQSFFGTDYIQAVLDALDDKYGGIIENNRFLFLYPSEDNGIYVLRNCKRCRDYIDATPLEEYISFRIEK